MFVARLSRPEGGEGEAGIPQQQPQAYHQATGVGTGIPDPQELPPTYPGSTLSPGNV